VVDGAEMSFQEFMTDRINLLKRAGQRVAL